MAEFKQYVDINMNGHKMTNLSAPVSNSEPVRKGDALRYVATANFTAGANTITHNLNSQSLFVQFYYNGLLMTFWTYTGANTISVEAVEAMTGVQIIILKVETL